MRKILFFLLLPFISLGQTKVEAIIINGDTVPYIKLKPVLIKERMGKIKEWNLTRLERNVKKAYPYAKIVRQKLQEYRKLTEGKNDIEKQFIKNRYETELKIEFEKDIRNLTVTQGIILVKLIDREVGSTSYDLIKDVKGGFSAFMWQSVSRVFGGDLKEKFDPENNPEDRQIENIIWRIDTGEL